MVFIARRERGSFPASTQKLETRLGAGFETQELHNIDVKLGPPLLLQYPFPGRGGAFLSFFLSI